MLNTLTFSCLRHQESMIRGEVGRYECSKKDLFTSCYHNCSDRDILVQHSWLATPYPQQLLLDH